MIKNYLAVAIRTLLRNKSVSAINIAGLSIGLACCMLIFLYAKDEWSYDGFHTEKDHIYRVTAQMIDARGVEEFKTGKSALVVGPSFQQDIPGIRGYVRFANNDYIVRNGSGTFNQRVHYADGNFFSVFTFPLLSGDPKKALADPHSLVITEKAAKKYFGNVDPIGKTLEIRFNNKFEPFTVSAIAKNCPQNSTIKFDFLLSMKFFQLLNPDENWLNFYLTTFLVLTPGASPATVLSKMTRVYTEKAAGQLKEAREKHDFNGSVHWGLQPFTQIHLSKDYDAEDELSDPSNPVYSYILTGIAVFILLIACINFINLTIGRSLKRSKEIGIRKVIGGRRTQLVWQFLGESFLACFIAFGFAILMALAALPVFNGLANKQLSLSYLFDTQLLLGFIGFFLITGFAAGFYPALVLSGFNPVDTLYQRLRLTGRNYLAKTLVVVQFALAGLLIISTFFIYQQFHYLTHQNLGYNDANLVTTNIETPDIDLFTRAFKTGLQRNSAIQSVAVHNAGREGTVAKADGKEITFDFEHIDENYLTTLQIPLIKGRNFSASFAADSANSVLVNETFAREAGWKDPIGKTVDFFYEKKKYTVIGVVADFHFRPLNEKIGSELFTRVPVGNNFLQFNIRIAPVNTPQTLAYIESTYKALAPFRPFSYTFRRDDNLHAYDTQEKWKQIITFAAAFTIFISCIGLFGLTALAAERRTKEIGIRKVLGASVTSLVQLLSLNFLKLVLIANLIALPIAWWAVNKWLDNFAYHIGIRWWVFALAVLITLFIALSTIGFRALRAAVANPVNNLRSE